MARVIRPQVKHPDATASKPLLEINKIIIFRDGGLGDLICTLPGLYQIRKKFPKSYMELWSKKKFVPILEEKSYINLKVNPTDPAALISFCIQNSNLDKKLEKYFSDFDLAIYYYPDKENIFGNNLKKCGIKKVIGTDEIYNLYQNQHIIDSMLEMLKILDIEKEFIMPKFFLNDYDRFLPYRYFGKKMLGDNNIAVIHPGSSNPGKNWAGDRFLEIANWLKEKFYFYVFIILGPNEVNMIKKFKRKQKKGIFIIPDIDLITLSALLEKSKIYLGNDSGISHLAAALDVNTIVLFGPTNPDIWAPRGNKVKIIRKNLDCLPCWDKTFENDGEKLCAKGLSSESLSCMESIEIEDVKKVIEDILI
ncbi:glycosyltransferase family 9 protein [Candidatus Poribacteria bacterium]|nr:glycosyltransferase family 9 protein [Candidatus Poribacteria bacterium]